MTDPIARRIEELESQVTALLARIIALEARAAALADRDIIPDHARRIAPPREKLIL